MNSLDDRQSAAKKVLLFTKRPADIVSLAILAAIFALYVTNAWIARRSAFFDDYLIQEVKIVQNICFFVLACVFYNKQPSRKAMIAVTVATFAVWAIAYCSIIFANIDSALLPSFKVATGLFEGMLNALVMTYCLWRMSKLDQRYVPAFIAIAFLFIEFIFDTALTWNDSSIFFVRFIFSFVSVAAIFASALIQDGANDEHDGPTESSAPNIDFVTVLSAMFVASLSFGLIRQIFSAANRSDGLHDASNGILMLAVLVISIGYYFIRSHKDLKWIHLGSTFCFILSVACLPFLYAIGASYYGAPLKCTWAIIQPLAYIYAVYIASLKPEKSIFYIGVMAGTFNTGASIGLLATKNILSAFSSELLTVFGISLATTSAIALIAIVAGALYRKTSNIPSQASDSSKSNLNSPIDTFPYKIAALSEAITLTEREREILVETSHGFSAESIGRKLHCSPETVRTHLKSIYGKAGVTNKQDLLETIDNYPT